MAADCLIVGYNDENFQDQVAMQRAMGTSHPNYRDLNLNFIEYEGRAYRAMDILDRFYHEGKPANGDRRRFHNADVLWMAITYLGTYLSKRGITFDYVNLFQLQKDELRDKLVNNDYLATIVTTTIYNDDSPIAEVVNFVREYNKKTTIIVGGPYIAKRAESMERADLDALFKYLEADIYVSSREGEQALVQVMRALKSDATQLETVARLKSIANVAFKHDGRYVVTRSAPERNILQDNLIDYSLFPPHAVGDYVNIRITKGCPFRCSFCSFPLRTDKYNVSQLAAIETELDAIKNAGSVSGLFFIDDTVNVPLTTFKDMMRLMILKDYGFKWHCFFRADFCDEETVELMARAGCQGVFLGLESANDRLLANMHKTPRKSHYRNTIPMFKRAGIQVFASLFFGFPGETRDTAQETMDFLEETKPDFFRSLIWYCDPVTPIWKERNKYNLKGYNFSWTHSTMNVDTACELMERSFLSFDTPCWVPDPGFNFVSLFLLQNRGMTFPQIKRFLNSFNAVVREKIIYPERAPSPALIERLRRAAQYDRSHPSEEGAIDILSAPQYVAAEKYWLSELAQDRGEGSPKPPDMALTRSAAPTGSGAPAGEKAFPIVIGQQHHGRTNEFLLVAWAAVAFSCFEAEEFFCEVELDQTPVFPVRVALHEDLGIGQLVSKLSERLHLGRQHSAFWPWIRDNVLRPTGGAFADPQARFAFRASRSGSKPAAIASGKGGAARQRDLACVIITEPALRAHFEWGEELDPVRVEEMARMLQVAVTCATQRPDVTLAELFGGQGRASGANLRSQHASEPGKIPANELGDYGVQR